MGNLSPSQWFFFKSKLQEYRTSKKVMQSTSTGGATAKAVEVSYRLSRLIAERGMPHTLGEEVMLPAIKESVIVMLGDKAIKQMDLIPLSNKHCSAEGRRRGDGHQCERTTNIADQSQSIFCSSVRRVNRYS